MQMRLIYMGKRNDQAIYVFKNKRDEALEIEAKDVHYPGIMTLGAIYEVTLSAKFLKPCSERWP